MQPNELTQLRHHWNEHTPPSDLADRIIANAMLHKQHRSFHARLRDAFARPSQSFAMKGFALAACVMVAVIAIDRPTSTPQKAKKYSMPMEQIVEEMIWSDYNY